MATLIWARRGRISLVLMLALIAAVWVQTRKSPALATSGGSAYAAPDVVDGNPDPDIVETTIVAQPATVDLGPGLGGLQANVLTFNGTIPGPTFRLRVGQTVIVNFENQIAHNTGIHWHGIELNNHSDGTPLTQNQVVPGGSFLYKFKVTRPGVYWYHPHHHSSTNQVFKGLYGMMVVSDADEDALITTGIIPAAADTLPMVLSDLTVCKAVGQNDTATYNPSLPHVSGGALPVQGGPKPSTLCEINPIDEDGAPRPPYIAGDVPNIQKAEGTGGPVNEGQTTLTNGRQVGGRQGSPSAPGTVAANADKYTVKKGQGLRLQFVNAATTRVFRLRLTDAAGAIVPLVKIGGQGGLLNHAVIEGGVINGFDTKITTGEIVLDPGDRIDAVVAIPANATNNSVLTLWTEDFQRAGNGNGGGGNNYTNIPTVPVAHFQVSGSVGMPFTIGAGTQLLEALGKSVEILPAATGSLLAPPAGAVGMTDPDIQLTASTNPKLGINGKVGIHDSPGDYTDFEYAESTRWARIGDVLELTVTNMTISAHHPFHLHGFSIQPLDLTKAGSPTFVYEPEYRDNIDVPPGYTLRFRVRLDDRKQVDGITDGGGLGRWVFHCHIFFHASFGMISEFDVVKNSIQKPNINIPICCVKWIHPSEPVEFRGTWVDRLGRGITLRSSIGEIAPIVRGGEIGGIEVGRSGLTALETTPAPTVKKGEFLWRYNARGGENQLVYLTITDADGNTDQAAFRLTVNAPPLVTVRPAGGGEGASIALHATAVDPEGSAVSGIHWSVAPSAGVDSGAACTIANPSALDTTVTCTDDGSYALTLTASDGNAVGTGVGLLTVTNAAPAVAIGTPAPGAVFLGGTPVAVQATASDPGTNDTHTCSIAWGDGATTAGASSGGVCSGVHTYAAVGGPRTISVKFTDDDLGAGAASVTIGIYTARSLKQSVRDAAATLATSAKGRTAEELREIVRNLDFALDPSQWVDGNTLAPKHGDKVFAREVKAVAALVGLKSRGDLPAATVQPHIDALETADGILARTALAAALAGSGDPREISESRAWLVKADAALAAGKFETAIEYYEQAWEHAVEALAPIRGHKH
jgi:FtsP/CotA-like multicopper oxidase with cupredoxin domain